MICTLMFIINPLQVQTSNVMFKVICDILTHWYDIYKTFVFSINICNAKKINCGMMFIISNHYGIKSLSILLPLERCNIM